MGKAIVLDTINAGSIPVVSQSKSVCDSMWKTDLLFCNMDTLWTRKVMDEKVWVVTTLRDRNLWTPQVSM